MHMSVPWYDWSQSDVIAENITSKYFQLCTSEQTHHDGRALWRESTMTEKREQDQTSKDSETEYNPFRQVLPSIALHCIRHAESANNEVYRNAKFLFRAGREDFDEEGCQRYIDTHRQADPGLSTKGVQQAEALSDFLVPHLENQASHPVRIIISPMKRTILTIQPTLKRIQRRHKKNGNKDSAVHIVIVAFYHETEGCHLVGVPEEGMKPSEIQALLQDCVNDPVNDIEFIGFPDNDLGRGDALLF